MSLIIALLLIILICATIHNSDEGCGGCLGAVLLIGLILFLAICL